MQHKILIVDDFENTRWVIELSLRKLNCETLHAGNGMEALKYFDGRNIDLLITDLNMPELDGIELVKRVRGDSRYEFIPNYYAYHGKKSGKKEKCRGGKSDSMGKKAI